MGAATARGAAQACQRTDEFDDRRMFVVGYTPGGAPYGCYEDEFTDLP
jgi:hypothetical protein